MRYETIGNSGDYNELKSTHFIKEGSSPIHLSSVPSGENLARGFQIGFFKKKWKSVFYGEIFFVFLYVNLKYLSA